jgi:hypothetical protein
MVQIVDRIHETTNNLEKTDVADLRVEDSCGACGSLGTSDQVKIRTVHRTEGEWWTHGCEGKQP